MRSKIENYAIENRLESLEVRLRCNEEKIKNDSIPSWNYDHANAFGEGPSVFENGGDSGQFYAFRIAIGNLSVRAADDSQRRIGFLDAGD